MSEKSLSPCLLQKKRLLREALPDLRRRYGVGDLWLFGSHVRGEDDEESDLDVLVAFNEPPTLFQFVRLTDELSALLDMPVDLVMKSALKPRIGERILAEIVPI